MLPFSAPGPVEVAVDLLVVTRLLETKTAVSGDYEQGIRATELDAQLVDNALEVAVDVAADDDGLDIRIAIRFHACRIIVYIRSS